MWLAPREIKDNGPWIKQQGICPLSTFYLPLSHSIYFPHLVFIRSVGTYACICPHASKRRSDKKLRFSIQMLCCFIPFMYVHAPKNASVRRADIYKKKSLPRGKRIKILSVIPNSH